MTHQLLTSYGIASPAIVRMLPGRDCTYSKSLLGLEPGTCGAVDRSYSTVPRPQVVDWSLSCIILYLASKSYSAVLRPSLYDGFSALKAIQQWIRRHTDTVIVVKTISTVATTSYPVPLHHRIIRLSLAPSRIPSQTRPTESKTYTSSLQFSLHHSSEGASSIRYSRFLCRSMAGPGPLMTVAGFGEPERRPCSRPSGRAPSAAGLELCVPRDRPAATPVAVPRQYRQLAKASPGNAQGLRRRGCSRAI